MERIRISSAQFENRSGDKAYNLSVMERLAGKAAAEGSQVIAFHECSITGYTFARRLSKGEMLDLAEFVPGGESINALTRIAARNNIVVLAGLFEKDKRDRIYKTYVCADGRGLIARYRKLHPFINPYLSPGMNIVSLTCLDGNAGSLSVMITTL